jgi:hypothetical protein
LTLLFHFTDFAEPQDEVRGLGLRAFTNSFFSGDAKQRFLARLAADVRETWEVTTTEQFLAERRHEEPRLRPRTILGVATTHETGACVVRDGKLLSAVTEERLSRKKMDNAYPPVLSIREAIRVSGVAPGEIDAVAIAGLDWRDLMVQTWRSLTADARDYQGLADYVPHALRVAYRFFSFWRSTGYERVLDFLEAELGIRPKAWYVDHHHAHAASAYRTGAAQEALIVTADGVGDDVCISFSEGRGRMIRTLKRYFYPNSFGQFYTACTQILGFKAGHHEGKITGLAGFGKRDDALLAKVEATFTRADGFRLGKRYYAEGWPRLRVRVFGDLLAGKLGVYSFEYRNYKSPLAPLLAGHPREDVAWTFQHLLEREMVRMVREVSGGRVKHVALAAARARVDLRLPGDGRRRPVRGRGARARGLPAGADPERVSRHGLRRGRALRGARAASRAGGLAAREHRALRSRAARRGARRRALRRAHGVRPARTRQPLGAGALRRRLGEPDPQQAVQSHRVHALRADLPVRGRRRVLRAARG